MKKIIAATFIFFTASPAFAYDITAYCQQVSQAVGGSYQIEETCRQQENTAKQNIAAMAVPEQIQKYCQDVGQAIGGSYQIKEVCIQQEMSAKSRL